MVQVPEQDSPDLESLKDIAAEGAQVKQVHPFDGATAAQILLAVSTAALPFFQAWMQSRVEAKKAFDVSISGRKFKGTTSDDVVKILKALDEEAK